MKSAQEYLEKVAGVSYEKMIRDASKENKPKLPNLSEALNDYRES